MRPLISVICPAYNEEKYIDKLLDFFVKSDPPDKEIIICDGISTDKTREIISEWQKKYPYIQCVENPKRYVSFGMNEAIRMSKGEYIARVDAHTEYPEDYLIKCLEVSRKTGADNVGGYIHSKGKGKIGKAIAIAMSSRFGVGDSDFRTAQVDGPVDTVPFGFWRREAFEKFGYFDVDLIRNQDDEFNYRICKSGGVVYQSSQITSSYYVRDSFLAVYKQYYQYGYYKPLVFKKLGNSGFRFRHLIPVFFSLYILTLPLGILYPIWCIPAIMYIILNIYFSFVSGIGKANIIYVAFAYFLLHFSYGAGSIAGIFRWYGN